MRNSFNKHQGFTLLEMLVVLVIIGLLAGLVGPRLLSNVDKANVKTAQTQIKMLQGGIGGMYLDIARNPTNEEGLALLNAPPSDEQTKPFWKGPYLNGDVPLDPWNRPYQYSVPGSKSQPFALYSFGADGQPGGIEYNADIGLLPPRD